MVLPFCLMDWDERTLLIQNRSDLLYCGEGWTDLSGNYGIPAWTGDSGWIVTERNGNTIFTKFGGASSLEFIYTKENQK